MLSVRQYQLRLMIYRDSYFREGDIGFIVTDNFLLKARILGT